jgi:hypothetical protein
MNGVINTTRPEGNVDSIEQLYEWFVERGIGADVAAVTCTPELYNSSGVCTTCRSCADGGCASACSLPIICREAA